MTKKSPNLAELADDQKDMLELLPGHPVVIKSKDLHMGRKLELLDKDGKFIAAITKNLTGNTPQEKSYTLEYIGGYKALIPVPYFCTTTSFLIDVRKNEDVEISLPLQSQPFRYRLAERGLEDISSIRPKIVEKRELNPEWQEIPLGDDQCLVFEGNQTVLARLFKVPNSREFILRDSAGKVLGHYFDGDEEVLGSSSGKKLFLSVKKGKFRVKGEMDFVLNVESIGQIKQVEAGRSDSFDEKDPEILKGMINGGRQVALASYREVGKVKKQLLHRNEDNGGFNTDTLVVADGLGGHYHGLLAADHATETLLNQKGDFKKAVQNTHERMVMFTEYYRRAEEMKSYEGDERPTNISSFEDDDEWFQLRPLKAQQKTPEENRKQFSVPDNVMAAVRFEGNKLRTMILGDSRIYVVRQGEIVYRSRMHTVYQTMLARGEITKREAMTGGGRSTVLTTMVGGFVPDYDEFELQKGDKVGLVSDGMDMREELIIEALSANTAEECVINLFKTKSQENIEGGDFYDPDDGSPPVQLPTHDNGTAAVVIHD